MLHIISELYIVRIVTFLIWYENYVYNYLKKKKKSQESECCTLWSTETVTKCHPWSCQQNKNRPGIKIDITELSQPSIKEEYSWKVLDWQRKSNLSHELNSYLNPPSMCPWKPRKILPFALDKWWQPNGYRYGLLTQRLQVLFQVGLKEDCLDWSPLNSHIRHLIPCRLHQEDWLSTSLLEKCSLNSK